MFNITAGVGLIIVALTAQWLIHKRLKNQKVSKAYSWIAWFGAVLGGAGITGDLGNAVGVTSGGAAVAALVMLLFIGVDLADRRPDWLAFILICLAPTFMRLAGGPVGDIFDLMLLPADWVLGRLSWFLGM